MSAGVGRPSIGDENWNSINAVIPLLRSGEYPAGGGKDQGMTQALNETAADQWEPFELSIDAANTRTALNGDHDQRIYSLEHGSRNTDAILMSLVARIEELEELASATNDVEVAGEVLELRNLDDEIAETEIITLFESKKTALYFSDVEDELAIPIEQVIRVCRKLMDEGRMGVGEAD